MQKYIEIDWLQDVDTIQRNALSPYISNTNEMVGPGYLKSFQTFLYQYILHMDALLS